MASLTIRNLAETLKGRLRVRAASRGRSMEDEARHILRAALTEAHPPGVGLAERIRRRFAGFGDVQVPVAAREAVRQPLLSGDESSPRKVPAAKRPRSAAPRRRK